MSPIQYLQFFTGNIARCFQLQIQIAWEGRHCWGMNKGERRRRSCSEQGRAGQKRRSRSERGWKCVIMNQAKACGVYTQIDIEVQIWLWTSFICNLHPTQKNNKPGVIIALTLFYSSVAMGNSSEKVKVRPSQTLSHSLLSVRHPVPSLVIHHIVTLLTSPLFLITFHSSFFGLQGSA